MNFLKRLVCLIIFNWIFFSYAILLAQQYVIQAGDKLSITFWQQPDLNTATTVSVDGTIEMPIIGRIKAAGLTPSQLSEQIVEEISRYRINITQATVVVTEYKGNKIYITGQVRSPGAYSFEVIPNLWKILQEAGGPLETAQLDNITIIRASEHGGQIIKVDLTKFFQKGVSYELPEIYGGDTIHVPGVTIVPGVSAGGIGGVIPGVGGGAISSSPMLSARGNEIYIFGQVGGPGRYPIEQNLNLLDAIILAGGPTPAAKLSQVKVYKRSSQQISMLEINIDEYLHNSEPVPIMLQPGDTIYIPRKSAFLSPFTREFIRVLGSATAGALIFSLLGVF